VEQNGAVVNTHFCWTAPFFDRSIDTNSQSPSTTQFFVGEHKGHSPPPQSMSVSLPPMMPSLQSEGVGVPVGAAVGVSVGAKVGTAVGSVGAAVGAVVGVAVGVAVGLLVRLSSS
jgi:hypothetical protein